MSAMSIRSRRWRAAVLAALMLLPSMAHGQVPAWTGGAGDDSWHSAGNWSTHAVPSAIGQAAVVRGDFDAALAITNASMVTLGDLTVGNSTGTLTLGNSGGAGFHFDAGTGAAALTMAAGSQRVTFAAPTSWTGGLQVTQNSTAAPLVFTGPLTGGSTFTKSGNGNVVINGDTSSFTGPIHVQGGRLTLGIDLSAAGSSGIILDHGGVLATAGQVNRAITGSADSMLLMQTPNFDGRYPQYGLQFGDASRADGFQFQGEIRADNQYNALVSATFNSAASIVIDRAQEINASIYYFPNGLTLRGAGQFRGSGVIVGNLTDQTTTGQPFVQNGDIPFVFDAARIYAGSADVHALAFDLRVGQLTMQGGTLRYHTNGPRTRYLDLYGPLEGYGTIEADYVQGFTMDGRPPPTISVTGLLTLQGAYYPGSTNVAVSVTADGIFRIHGSAPINTLNFDLAGGRVELPNVVASTVPASSFSGHGTILLGNPGSVSVGSVPLIGPANGAVTIHQDLNVGGMLGVFHSNAPVAIGPQATVSLANGMIVSATGFTVTGNSRISGHGLIFGAVTDLTGGAGGLVASGTLSGFPTIDLPAGSIFVLSQGEASLPFRSANRTGATTITASHGVALQQVSETITPPQPLAVVGNARLLGNYNAGPLSVTGNLTLEGGFIESPITATGTVTGYGRVDGAIVAAAIAPVGTLPVQSSMTFRSGTRGYLLSDSVVTMAPGSTLTLSNTQVSVPNGINLQGQTLMGSGGIDHVLGTPLQILTGQDARQTLHVDFAPGAGSVNNLRLGRSAAVLSSDRPVVISNLTSDGSPDVTTRRMVESNMGINVQTLFSALPPPLRTDLRVRGPLNLTAGTSSKLLETDAATFNGGRVADLVSHGAVTVNGNFTADNRVVLVEGGTVNAGKTLTTPNVFGHLVVDGTWTAAGGATITGLLGGTGTINGALTVHGSGSYTNAGLDVPLDLNLSGGGINPGGNLPGTLTIAGTLTLQNTATLHFDLLGAATGAHDQIQFTSAGVTSLTDQLLKIQPWGNVDFAGDTVALLVNLGTGSFGGTTFAGLEEGVLIDLPALRGNISYVGSFDPVTGLAIADGLGNDVVLYNVVAVPEPGTLALIGFGACAGATVWLRRRADNRRR